MFFGQPSGISELEIESDLQVGFFETGVQCGSSPALSKDETMLVIACEDGYLYGIHV